MKKETAKRWALVAFLILLTAPIGFRTGVWISHSVQFNQEPVATTTPEVVVPKPELSHAQRTWLYALEWCESRGNPDALNPMDNDGTPSYGSWQFKPDTFWYFADKYDVDVASLQDQIDGMAATSTDPKTGQTITHLKANYYYRSEQLKVMEAMILHRDEINWNQQFPACVARLGWPPKK